MLVLSLAAGESLTIGDNIKITAVEQRGSGKIRLGFDAPREVQILRTNAKVRTPKVDQHDGPLEADGGPPGAPAPAPSERADEWHHEPGTPPDLTLLGITPKKPR